MFRPSGTPEPKVTSPVTGLSLDYRRMKNGRWPKLQRFFTGHKEQLPVCPCLKSVTSSRGLMGVFSRETQTQWDDGMGGGTAGV